MSFIDPLILDGVRDVLRAVSSDCTLEELEEALVQAACKVAGTPHGVWFRVQPLDGNLPGLEATAAAGIDQEQVASRRIVFPADASTAAGRATLSAAPEAEAELSRIPHPLVPANAVCEYCFPIVTDGELVGIIDLFSTEPGAFPYDVVRSLEALAGLLAPASEIHTKWQMQRQLRHEVLEYDTHASFGKLLSAIAHEVNDPLASIFGGASLLELEVSDREHKGTIGMIRDEAGKASALLRQLMAFSKRTPRPAETLDFRTLVQNITDITRPVLKAQGSRVVLTLPEKEFPVSVDRVAMAQAIFALVTHSDVPGRRVTIALEAGKGRATLTVSDSLASLSGPEETAIGDQLSAGSASGSFPAVRLAAARSAIAANGGALKAGSADDAAARFKFTLPLYGADTPGAGAPAPGETPAQAKPARSSVLIVDDEPAVRDMLGNLFRRHHCDVVIARDGEEALVLAQAEVFDIVVSDVRMPRLSGPEFYHRLLDCYGGRYDGKFIFITGDMDSLNEDSGVAGIGSLPVVQKPFPPGKLLEIAEVALPS